MCLEYLKKSFSIYRKNFFPIVCGASLILATFALIMLLGIVFLFENSTSSLVSSSVFDMEKLNDTPHLIAGVVVIAIGLLLLLMLQGGLYGMAYESILKKTNIRTMFSTVKKRWVAILGAFAIQGVIFAMLMIPSIAIMIALPYPNLTTIFFVLLIALVSVFFSFIFPAVIEGNGPVDAVKKSFFISKKRYIKVLLIVVFFSIFSSLLNMIPLIGTIISFLLIMPWNYITISYFYKKNKK